MNLPRHDGPPASIHAIQGIEAMAFVQIFPHGTNHFDTRRDVLLHDAMYFRARVMSADDRCQEPHYMAYMSSSLHYLQLQTAVKIRLRWERGAPTTRQVLERVEEQRSIGAEELTGNKV